MQDVGLGWGGRSALSTVMLGGNLIPEITMAQTQPSRELG